MIDRNWIFREEEAAHVNFEDLAELIWFSADLIHEFPFFIFQWNLNRPMSLRMALSLFKFWDIYTYFANLKTLYFEIEILGDFEVGILQNCKGFQFTVMSQSYSKPKPRNWINLHYRYSKQHSRNLKTQASGNPYITTNLKAWGSGETWCQRPKAVRVGWDLIAKVWLNSWPSSHEDKKKTTTTKWLQHVQFCTCSKGVSL